MLYYLCFKHVCVVEVDSCNRHKHTMSLWNILQFWNTISLVMTFCYPLQALIFKYPRDPFNRDFCWKRRPHFRQVTKDKNFLRVSSLNRMHFVVQNEYVRKWYFIIRFLNISLELRGIVFDYQLISFNLQFWYSLTKSNNDNNPETCTYLLLVLEFEGFEMDESQLSVRS